MKCRYEIECDCDFETLNGAQQLAALRVFANIFPLMMIDFVKMTELLRGCSVSLKRDIDLAGTDAAAAKVACVNYAEAVNELNGAFSDVFKMYAELLGKALHVVGLQPNTAAPSTKTMQ